MSLLSAFVDLAMAGLMVALLVYCVKLNRRLAAVRESDSEIRQMIVGLQNAADRADASVGALKAVGVDAERQLRVQVVRAEALCNELGALVRRPAPAAPGPDLAPQPAPQPVRRAAPRPAARPAPRRAPAAAMPPVAPDDDGVPYPDLPPAARPARRSEAEEELLRAIRIARAEG